jgi:hypothetical protein
MEQVYERHGERMKILFLYTGQARLVVETLVWHHYFHKKVLNKFKPEEEVTLDIKYVLWDYLTTPGHSDQFDGRVLIDTEQLIQNVKEYHNKNKYANRLDFLFYNYLEAEEFYKQFLENFPNYANSSRNFKTSMFIPGVSQTLIRSLGVSSIDDDYNVVLICRTDTLFDSLVESSERLVNWIVERCRDYAVYCRNYKRVYVDYNEYPPTKKEYPMEDIFVPDLEYNQALGLKSHDAMLIGSAAGFKIMYSGYKEKFIHWFRERYSLIKNRWSFNDRTDVDFFGYNFNQIIDPHISTFGWIYCYSSHQELSNKVITIKDLEYIRPSLCLIRAEMSHILPADISEMTEEYMVNAMNYIRGGWRYPRMEGR